MKQINSFFKAEFSKLETFLFQFEICLILSLIISGDFVIVFIVQATLGAAPKNK
ncbi:MAG: hypothetical protein JWQ71_3342 [Pedosphaera sp.]|nr:hypothetical protein [Pedosphaera sp.]